MIYNIDPTIWLQQRFMQFLCYLLTSGFILVQVAEEIGTEAKFQNDFINQLVNLNF